MGWRWASHKLLHCSSYIIGVYMEFFVYKSESALVALNFIKATGQPWLQDDDSHILLLVHRHDCRGLDRSIPQVSPRKFATTIPAIGPLIN